MTAARAVQSVAPDGTHSDSLTGLRSQYSQDANGFICVAFSGVFGWATAVDETLVQWSDRFGTISTALYPVTGNAMATGGVVRVVGRGSADGILRNPACPLAEREGAIFDFQVTTDAAAAWGTLYLRGGSYGVMSGVNIYRAYALSVDDGQLWRRSILGSTQADAALMPVLSGVWYRAMIKVGDAGQYSIVSVWERNNSAVNAERREGLTGDWLGKRWDFVLQGWAGAFEADNPDEMATPARLPPMAPRTN